MKGDLGQLDAHETIFGHQGFKKSKKGHKGLKGSKKHKGHKGLKGSKKGLKGSKKGHKGSKKVYKGYSEPIVKLPVVVVGPTKRLGVITDAPEGSTKAIKDSAEVPKEVFAVASKEYVSTKKLERVKRKSQFIQTFQVSISSTFYARIFRMNVVSAAYSLALNELSFENVDEIDGRLAQTVRTSIADRLVVAT